MAPNVGLHIKPVKILIDILVIGKFDCKHYLIGTILSATNRDSL